MSDNGYLVVSCISGSDFKIDGRHKLMVEFNNCYNKNHYMQGGPTYDFHTCFCFQCTKEVYQNEPITIYVMNDKGFAHHPKKVALYKLTGVANGGNVLWGPKTVICKSLKSGLDYCKLTIQVQYITYRDSISQPIVDPNNLPVFQQILFKINRVVLSKEKWYKYGISICLYSGHHCFFHSDFFESDSCNILCIIPQFVIQSKKTVSLRLYYGNEKYLGENCFPLSDFATYEVSNHSQTFQCKSHSTATIHFQTQCFFFNSRVSQGVITDTSTNYLTTTEDCLPNAPLLLSTPSSASVPAGSGTNEQSNSSMNVEVVIPVEQASRHMSIPNNTGLLINEGNSKGDKLERSSNNQLIKQNETAVNSIQSTEQAPNLNRSKSHSIHFISSSQSIQSLSSSQSYKSLNSFSSAHLSPNHTEQTPAICPSHSMSYHSVAIPSSLSSEDLSTCKDSPIRNMNMQMNVSQRCLSRSPIHTTNRLSTIDSNRFTSIPTLMSINRSI